MRRDESILLTVASGGHALCHISTLILQQVLVEAALDLNARPEEIGWIMTLCQFLVGAGAVPTGLLGDRFGPRRVYLGYLALLAGACAAAALATQTGPFIVAVGLVGAAAAFHHPVGLAWIAEAIPERRGKALGIHGFIGHFGSTLAPAVVLSLQVRFGWRAAYAAVSGGALLLLLLMVTLVKATPAEASARTSTPTRARVPWRLVFAAGVVVLLLAMVANGFVHQGFWASWTSFLKDEVGATAVGGSAAAPSLVATAEQGRALLPAWFLPAPKAGDSPLVPVAGALASAVLVFGSLGELFGGELARRGRGLSAYAWMTALSALGLLGLAFLRGPLLLVAGALFAFFHFGTQPIENDLIAQRADPRVRGLAYGLKFAVTFGVGSAASAACVYAYRAPGVGFARVFIGLAVLAVLGVLAVVVIARRVPQATAATVAPPR